MNTCRRCVARRQPDGTYRCACGHRWDADLRPIEALRAAYSAIPAIRRGLA